MTHPRIACAKILHSLYHTVPSNATCVLSYLLLSAETTNLLGNGVQGRMSQPRPGDDEGSRVRGTMKAAGARGVPASFSLFPKRWVGSALVKRARNSGVLRILPCRYNDIMINENKRRVNRNERSITIHLLRNVSKRNSMRIGGTSY